MHSFVIGERRVNPPYGMLGGGREFICITEVCYISDLGMQMVNGATASGTESIQMVSAVPFD